MLSRNEFVRKSLDLHLFFARIMKEHSFFLEIGFTPKDADYSKQADEFRMQFDKLLLDVISISNGVVSPGVLKSGEVVTPFTLPAEKMTTFYTGINIPTNLTTSELSLSGGVSNVNSEMERKVSDINNRAIKLVSDLIRFKKKVLSNVLACKMFTVNYPLLIDHILREATLYLETIKKLQTRLNTNTDQEAYQQEYFWNRIMAEHSKFIRGLFDPTEESLIKTANNFGNEFDALTNESKKAMDRTIPLSKVTKDSLKATVQLRNFKRTGTEGILDCKIKSVIIPLLGDHVLREANHFIRLLEQFEVKK